MSAQELTTNVYRITNLDSLEAEYSLFRVRGLDRDHEDYHRNRSQIEYGIRRIARAPACVYEDDIGLVAAVGAGTRPVPERLDVVRATVRLDSLGGSKTLHFAYPDPRDIGLCLNVLHFHFQETLERNGALWQPGSGQPLFSKEPEAFNRGLNLYRGFAVRPGLLPEGGFGVVVDVKHRYVRRHPLPSDIDRNAFRSWKGRKFIYHFGENWYEIRLDLFLGLSVSEIDIPIGNGKAESLFEYLLRHGGKPLPKELTQLSPDDAAVSYFNGSGDQKSAPASLCYATETSEHPDARRFERDVKLQPAARRKVIDALLRKHLISTTHNGQTVKLSSQAEHVPRRTFAVPELIFGNETTLSTGRSGECVYAPLKDWGRRKKELLLDGNVGFLDKEPLGRQYLVLPETVADSYGPKFKEEISRAAGELFPQESRYEPREITFDDRGCRTTVEVGGRIIRAVENAGLANGHGLVVVPRLRKSKPREQDELAALVVRELYARGLTVAVSHTEVPNECFTEQRSRDNGLEYVIAGNKQGKWAGYVRGLVLNKILLTNERWPFAFKGRMHADVTIGIDVKNNTAGFVLIDPKARIIRMHCAASRRKERLSEDQLAVELFNLIAAEASYLELGISQIAIMRDGRLYEEEQRGIRRAMERLAIERFAAAPPEATMIEVHKTSAMSVRLFDILEEDGIQIARNPRVGDYMISGEDGFLCTTGWPFVRPGTVRPLHVKHLGGGMSFEDCLKDLYWLSCLTYTRPDDCSRVPINLRLLDRRLREEAGEYDEDSVRYQAQISVRTPA